MPVVNSQFTDFDPSSLQPAGPAKREQYGVSSGDQSTEYIESTPLQGPDGKTYVRMQRIGNDGNPIGGATFATQGSDGKPMRVQQDQFGRWYSGEFDKRSGFADTVLGDQKLMTFLAIATAGSAAGMAGYGSGVTGITAGTGATPGTAGAVLSSSGAGGAVGGVGAAGAGAAPISVAKPSVGGGSTAGGSSLYSPAGDMGVSAASGAVPGAVPAGIPASTWSEIATRFGGSVVEWAKANPNLAASLGLAALGYLGNKDDKTDSTTTTSKLDPAAEAQRQQIYAGVNQFASTPPPQYRAGNQPGGATWGTPTGAPTGALSPTKSLAGSGTPTHARPTGLMGTGGNVATKDGMVTDMMYRGPSTGGAAGTMLGGGLSMSSPTMQLPSSLGGSGFSGVVNNDIGSGQFGTTPGSQPGGGSGGGAGGTTPDWIDSNRYMPGVSNYLQQGTGHLNATANPLAGENNPYLTGMIDSAGKDMRQYYDQFIAPKFSSGNSFGSSGLAFAEVAERDRQADNFSSMATDLRFQDHNLRSDLMEQGALRQDNLNSGARSNAITAGQTFGELGQNAGEFNAKMDYTMFQDQELWRQQRINALLATGNVPGGGTTTGSQTQQGNPWAGAAAGAVAGANLWSGTNPKTTKSIWG